MDRRKEGMQAMTFMRTAGLIVALLGATALTAPRLLAQETATTTAVEPTVTDATDTTGEPSQGLLSEDELDQLFAPVALYPDALLAQVLLAATYPLDVVKANQFLTKNEGKSAQEMSDLVAAQDWPDPVKGLAAGFPDLLGRMVEHIDWTEMAGDALIGQTDDCLASLQRLRAQAKLNGYLEDNAAMNVEEDADTGSISISSANPEVVYVPQYTETVYTTPAPATPVYVTDDDDWDDWLATGAIVWGGAILIDEIFDDDHWDDNWGNYWHGGGSGNGNHIDWDGDVNIDNGINIGNGIGNGIGNRPGIGNGDGIGNGIGNRPGLGNGDGIGNGNLGDGNFGGAVAGGIAGGIAGGALNRPTTLPAERLGSVDADRIQNARDGNFRPTDASRDAAREKIASHKAGGGSLATLPAATGKGDRVGKATTRPATADRPQLTSPEARAKVQNRPAAAAPKVNKPKVSSRPSTANRAAAPKRQPSYKPSSGSRAKASSSRGKSSRGGRR